jgi:hypothetical protein
LAVVSAAEFIPQIQSRSSSLSSVAEFIPRYAARTNRDEIYKEGMKAITPLRPDNLKQAMAPHGQIDTYYYYPANESVESLRISLLYCFTMQDESHWLEYHHIPGIEDGHACKLDMALLKKLMIGNRA